MLNIFAVYFSSDDVWKIHRKSLNYSFNLKILQTFIPTFIENANKLVDDLSVNVGKVKEFDMLTYTTKSALNMICGEFAVTDYLISDAIKNDEDKYSSQLRIRNKAALYRESHYIGKKTAEEQANSAFFFVVHIHQSKRFQPAN